MTSTKKDPILVVIQLTGGNDPLNTIVPYNNPIYYDNRPNLAISESDVLKIDNEYGFNSALGPIKELYDQGKVSIINGVGYQNPNRSHFRSMDIWHTCEPDKVGTEGWLGRVIRDIDPNSENVLTGVNFGKGLPRSLAVSGVPVASVSMLESYGILNGVTEEPSRSLALDIFSKMYAPTIGSGAVMDYLGQTGLDALKGADILKTAPQKYSSSVEYADTLISNNLKGIAKVLTADLGTRIFYTEQIGYDTHAGQAGNHEKLWTDLSRGVKDFYTDLQEHNVSDQVVMLLFTEFGRRVQDNGTGTDHGSGGIAFAIGDSVKGGMYGEYPSLKEEDLLEGDLQFNHDFRGVYTTVVENWLNLDPVSVTGGQFEKLSFI
ncbi:MAG TPA: hypothetical protein DEZ08_06375 [Dehalococcoidia bacterium]|jgi:uncharacterized protein (DUF1501 family)|nr:hypothetical protein [Dehalococcoidia bacterium]|tara:strand:+ start:609 stop:1736 length:1128 start_codon:yes stop_codon:yes gene_type:complete